MSICWHFLKNHWNKDEKKKVVFDLVFVCVVSPVEAQVSSPVLYPPRRAWALDYTLRYVKIYKSQWLTGFSSTEIIYVIIKP